MMSEAEPGSSADGHTAAVKHSLQQPPFSTTAPATATPPTHALPPPVPGSAQLKVRYSEESEGDMRPVYDVDMSVMRGSGAGEGEEGEGEGEGEVASTTMAERTLVEGSAGATGEEGGRRTHAKGPSTSSLSLPTKEDYLPKKSLDRQHYRDGSLGGRLSEEQPKSAGTTTTAATWDPLKTSEDVDNKIQLQDDTIIVEVDGDEEVDSNGKSVYPREQLKPASAVPPRRASHLHLDLKSASPTPWERVEPPLDNNLKSIAGYYSPMASQKFRTLQNFGSGPRPLIPKSSYYFGPPPPNSAYGTLPAGQIGVHHPREILRVERDYTGGELIQFAPIYPLELEGRITQTQFLESINAINELLISAHSLRHSLADNALAIFSLQISKLFVKTHFEKEMSRLRTLIDDLNTELYNPVGLNILWPRNVAFLFLEIEYYVSRLHNSFSPQCFPADIIDFLSTQ